MHGFDYEVQLTVFLDDTLMHVFKNSIGGVAKAFGVVFDGGGVFPFAGKHNR